MMDDYDDEEKEEDDHQHQVVCDEVVTYVTFSFSLV